jgi:hypothetical protein
MDWRAVRAGRAQGEGAFYESCLLYAHHLWIRALPARAILCLDRALFADLTGNEAALAPHPPPYAALAWFLQHVPRGLFVGNPRVHYQHLAGRVRGPRTAIKSARAWACWHVVRAARPELPSDPRHAVREPPLVEIEAGLARDGRAGEVQAWLSALEMARERES